MQRRPVSLIAMAILLAAGLSPAFAGDAPLPAFPGAEGFGATSVGGRGGRVIKVTNLNASGEGSLQWACDQKGPRIVVFEVGGVIKPPPGKNSGILISDSRITIAGQTAPSPGITILGMLRSAGDYRAEDSGYGLPGLGGARWHDLTFRFLRLRPSAAGGSGGDCIQFAQVDRMIFDHISCSGASDETVDINGCENYTVQWCSIEASDTARGAKSDPWEYRDGDGPKWKPTGTAPHNFGMIFGYGRGDATLHHTLFAHHNRRAPLCGIDILDHRNNVIYNVFINLLFHPSNFNRRNPGKPFRANVVGNYFKDGPSCPDRYPVSSCKGAEVYAEGNHFTGGRFADGKGAVRPDFPTPMPFAAPPVTMHSAEGAYKLVLAHAGCLPRDVVSRKTVEDVRKGTGSWGRPDVAGDPNAGLPAGKPPVDTDDDGMPDAWETAHGLDPKDPSDNSRIVPAGASEGDRHKGYTYIEFYINELADKLIANAVADAGAGDVKPAPNSSPAPVADPAAVAMKLSDADPGVRRAAAQSLAKTDPAKAVPVLVEALSSESADTRMSAAWALGQLGPAASDAIDALAGLLAAGSAKARERDTSGSWTDVRDEQQCLQEREHAAGALAAIGPKAVPALVKALEAEHPETRVAAAEALRMMGPPAVSAVPALVKRFDDPDRWASAYAALAVFAIAPDTEGLVAALVKPLGGDPGKEIWKDRKMRGLNVPYRLVYALGLLGPKAAAAEPKVKEVAGWMYGNHKVRVPVVFVANWALGRISGKIPAETPAAEGGKS